MRVWRGHDPDLITKEEYEAERTKLRENSRDPPKLLELMQMESLHHTSPAKNWSPKRDVEQQEKAKEAEEFVKKL